MLSREREEQLRIWAKFDESELAATARDCLAEIDRLRALCKRASVWIDQDPRWQEAEPLRSELKAAGGE